LGGITSMTRLPTGTPTRPVSQPGMIWAGEAPISKPNGAPRDQEESKTLRVRQLRPTYCVTTSWPLATGGPDPLISVLTTSLLGRDGVGTFTLGAVPVLAETVGRLPPPLDTLVPDADAVPVYSLIMSTTNTSVSLPVMPTCELPLAP